MRKSVCVLVGVLMMSMLYAPNHLQAAEVFFSKESASIGKKCVKIDDNKASNRCDVDVQIKFVCKSTNKNQNFLMKVGTNPIDFEECKGVRPRIAACAYDPNSLDRSVAVEVLFRDPFLFRCAVYSDRRWYDFNDSIVSEAGRKDDILLKDLLRTPN